MNLMDNYLPIEYGILNQIVTILNIKPGEKFLDLGSGDGRAVIAAATLGADATGIEIDPQLIQESRNNIQNSGVNATIIEGNMFDIDLSTYDIIYTYLSHDSLRILFEKFKQNYKIGSRMSMWCGIGTMEGIIARACSDCTYLIDEQYTGGTMHRLVSDVDGSVYYVLIENLNIP